MWQFCNYFFNFQICSSFVFFYAFFIWIFCRCIYFFAVSFDFLVRVFCAKFITFFVKSLLFLFFAFILLVNKLFFWTKFFWCYHLFFWWSQLFFWCKNFKPLLSLKELFSIVQGQGHFKTCIQSNFKGLL